MHMAMTPIPYSHEIGIKGSIHGQWRGCQGKPVWNELLYDNIVICHNCFMKPSKRRSSRVFTISFPEALAKQVLAVAKEENRNISELFREAFRSYRLDRIHGMLEVARAEAMKRGPIPYTEDDVEALVDEIRSANFSKRKKTA
jgi:hypothetical protein